MEAAPGNTLAAFAAAARLRPDVVELDVHLDRDGVVIVSHDAADDGSAPSLRSVMDLLAPVPALAVQIDVKPDATATPHPGIATALGRVLAPDGLGPRVLLSSLDPALLPVLLAAVPGSRGRTALMPGNAETLGGAAAAIACYRAVGVEVIDINRAMASAEVLALARDAGCEVGVATVNGEAALRHYLAGGWDRIVTDEPERALRLRAGASSQQSGRQSG